MRNVNKTVLTLFVVAAVGIALGGGFGGPAGTAAAQEVGAQELTCNPLFPDWVVCSGTTGTGLTLPGDEFPDADTIELDNFHGTNPAQERVVTVYGGPQVIVSENSTVVQERDDGATGYQLFSGAGSRTVLNHFGLLEVESAQTAVGVSSIAAHGIFRNEGDVHVAGTAAGGATGAFMLGKQNNVSNKGLLEVSAETADARGVAFLLSQPGAKAAVHQLPNVPELIGAGKTPGRISVTSDSGRAIGIHGIVTGQDTDVSINNDGEIAASSETGAAAAIDLLAGMESTSVYVNNSGYLFAFGAEARGIGARLAPVRPADAASPLMSNSGTIVAGFSLDSYSSVAGDVLRNTEAFGIDASGGRVQLIQSPDGAIYAGAAYAAGVRLKGDDNLVLNEGVIGAASPWGPRCSLVDPDEHDDVCTEDGGAAATAAAERLTGSGIELFGNKNEIHNKHEIAAVLFDHSTFAAATVLSAAGVALYGDDNDVDNEHEIVASADGTTVDAAGVAVEGDGNRVVNKGSIEARAGTIYTDAGRFRMATGVIVFGNNNSFVNLDDAGEVIAFAQGKSAHAEGVVWSGSGGSVDNDGLIEAVADGDDYGRAAGVTLTVGNGDTKLTNRGHIDARGTSEATGVELYTAFSITPDGAPPRIVVENDGFGLITAQGSQPGATAYGVAISPEYPDDVAYDAIGFLLTDTMPRKDEDYVYTVINRQGALIHAGGYDAEDVAVAIGTSEPELPHASVRIVNHGQLRGDIRLGAGVSKVELHPDSSIDGDVLLGGGVSVAEVWHGAGISGVVDGQTSRSRVVLRAAEDASGTGDLTGKLRNIDTVDIVSGSWKLDKDFLAQRETIARRGVRLEVGAFTVAAGGRLGGNGIFVGDIANEAGTVAPGESIGELTIAGSYEHHADAVLEIEIDPRQSDPAQRSDRLVVTAPAVPADPTKDGKAFLNGGIVRVLPVANTLVKGSEEFVILEAEKGVEGVFAGTDPEGASGFLKYGLVYDTSNDPLWPDKDQVVLQITRVPFVSAARGGNQRAVAAVLDQMLDDVDATDPAQAERASLLHRMQYGLQAADAPKAFAALGGEAYAMASEARLAALSRLPTHVSTGLIATAAPDEDYNHVWAVAYGDNAAVTGDAGHAAGDVTVRGTMVGMHIWQRPGAVAGLTVGYGQSRLTPPLLGAGVRTDTNYVGGYAQTTAGRLILNGVLAYGWDEYDVQRTVSVPLPDQDWEQTTVARFRGNSLVAVTGAYIPPVVWGGLALQPGVALTWSRTSHDAVQETGAGSFGLVVDPYVDSRLQLEIGANVYMSEFQLGSNWIVFPAARIGWLHNFAPAATGKTMHFAGAAGTNFTSAAVHGAGGLRLTVDFVGGRFDNDWLRWSVGYEGQLRSTGNAHSLRAGVGVEF